MARKNDILDIYTKEVEGIKEAGLFKGEAPFVSPQGARVKMEDGRELLCMCANNYLGLGDNPRLIEAAKRTYDEKGYGVASVRFICGTQDIHKRLEKKISDFLIVQSTSSSLHDRLLQIMFHFFELFFPHQVFICGCNVGSFSMNSDGKSLFFQIVVGFLHSQGTDLQFL